MSVNPLLTTLSNSKISLSVSAQGAEMQSLCKDGAEYLWQGDPKYWADRAINLFPVTGRLFGQKYTLNGKTYDMPMHGFAKNSAFTLIKQSQNCLSYRLTHNEHTLSHYPYQFELLINYTLTDNTVKVAYQVTNQSPQTMYFALGGHPGFNVPLDKGAFDDYIISFSALDNPMLVGFEGGLVNGQYTPYNLTDNQIPLSHNLFKGRPLFLKGTGHSATLYSPLSARRVTVDYADMDILGLWHLDSSDAPYVCIEPWTALPGRAGTTEELSTKRDMTVLDTGKTYSVSWSITID